MLSDREQRALEELERCYATEAREPVRSGRATRRSPHRPSRPPGHATVLVLAGVSLALLFLGVPTAAVALGLATVIGWLFWCLWWLRADDGRGPNPWWTGPGDGRRGPQHRPGESLRRYLVWLSEAE